jgi:hypothetical protein
MGGFAEVQHAILRWRESQDDSFGIFSDDERLVRSFFSVK